MRSERRSHLAHSLPTVEVPDIQPATRQPPLHPGPSPIPTLALAYDSHRNNFGFLRFLLASTVIWSHSYVLSGRPGDPLWMLSHQIDGGSVAVDGFFVLSGFLVTQSWMQQPFVRPFAIKRLLRLMPALLLALPFGAFAIAPMASSMPFGQYVRSSGPWLHFFGFILSRYLFIPESFAGNPYPHLVNSPLWSLRYEILCYALLALFGAIFGRRHLGILAVCLFVASLLLYSCLPASVSPLSILSQTPRLLAAFAAGMIFFLYRDRVPVTGRWALAAGLVVGVAVFVGGLRSILPWAGGYLIIYFACKRNMRLNDFARYGDFSYGLYIFACPLQQLAIYHLGPTVPIFLLLMVTYIPALILAALSWQFVESPALRLKAAFAR